jgi:hypothetical protein
LIGGFFLVDLFLKKAHDKGVKNIKEVSDEEFLSMFYNG